MDEGWSHSVDRWAEPEELSGGKVKLGLYLKGFSDPITVTFDGGAAGWQAALDDLETVTRVRRPLDPAPVVLVSGGAPTTMAILARQPQGATNKTEIIRLTTSFQAEIPNLLYRINRTTGDGTVYMQNRDNIQIGQLTVHLAQSGSPVYDYDTNKYTVTVNTGEMQLATIDLEIDATEAYLNGAQHGTPTYDFDPSKLEINPSQLLNGLVLDWVYTGTQQSQSGNKGTVYFTIPTEQGGQAVYSYDPDNHVISFDMHGNLGTDTVFDRGYNIDISSTITSEKMSSRADALLEAASTAQITDIYQNNPGTPDHTMTVAMNATGTVKGFVDGTLVPFNKIVPNVSINVDRPYNEGALYGANSVNVTLTSGNVRRKSDTYSMLVDIGYTTSSNVHDYNRKTGEETIEVDATSIVNAITVTGITNSNPVYNSANDTISMLHTVHLSTGANAIGNGSINASSATNYGYGLAINEAELSIERKDSNVVTANANWNSRRIEPGSPTSAVSVDYTIANNIAWDSTAHKYTNITTVYTTGQTSFNINNGDLDPTEAISYGADSVEIYSEGSGSYSSNWFATYHGSGQHEHEYYTGVTIRLSNGKSLTIAKYSGDEAWSRGYDDGVADKSISSIVISDPTIYSGISDNTLEGIITISFNDSTSATHNYAIPATLALNAFKSNTALNTSLDYQGTTGYDSSNHKYRIRSIASAVLGGALFKTASSDYTEFGSEAYADGKADGVFDATVTLGSLNPVVNVSEQEVTITQSAWVYQNKDATKREDSTVYNIGSDVYSIVGDGFKTLNITTQATFNGIAAGTTRSLKTITFGDAKMEWSDSDHNYYVSVPIYGFTGQLSIGKDINPEEAIDYGILLGESHFTDIGGFDKISGTFSSLSSIMYANQNGTIEITNEDHAFTPAEITLQGTIAPSPITRFLSGDPAQTVSVYTRSTVGNVPQDYYLVDQLASYTGVTEIDVTRSLKLSRDTELYRKNSTAYPETYTLKEERTVEKVTVPVLQEIQPTYFDRCTVSNDYGWATLYDFNGDLAGRGYWICFSNWPADSNDMWSRGTGSHTETYFKGNDSVAYEKTGTRDYYYIDGIEQEGIRVYQKDATYASHNGVMHDPVRNTYIVDNENGTMYYQPKPETTNAYLTSDYPNGLYTRVSQPTKAIITDETLYRSTGTKLVYNYNQDDPLYYRGEEQHMIITEDDTTRLYNPGRASNAIITDKKLYELSSNQKFSEGTGLIKNNSGSVLYKVLNSGGTKHYTKNT